MNVQDHTVSRMRLTPFYRWLNQVHRDRPGLVQTTVGQESRKCVSSHTTVYTSVGDMWHFRTTDIAGSTGTGSGFHDANRMFNLISDWWSSWGRQAQCGEKLDTPKTVSGGGGWHFPAQLAVLLSLAGYLCHQSLESSPRQYSRAARDHEQSRELYHFTQTPWDHAKGCTSHMQKVWWWRFWPGESWFLASSRNNWDQTGAHS